MTRRRRLGEILVEMRVLDSHQLQVAFSHHQQWGMSLGQAVIDREFCTPAQVLKALSIQTGLPSIDLDREEITPKLAAMLPHKVAERYRAVPLRLEGKRREILVVAVAAPASLGSLDAIRSASGKNKVVPFVAGDEAIRRALGVIYLGLSVEAAKPSRYAEPVLHRERAVAFDTKVSVQSTEAAHRPVLIYGWHPIAATKVIQALKLLEIPSQEATDDDVMACTQQDVVVAPLLALEALLALGQQAPGQVVVSGGDTAQERRAAKMIGAREYLGGSLSPKLLAEAVRRCRQARESHASASNPNDQAARAEKSGTAITK